MYVSYSPWAPRGGVVWGPARVVAPSVRTFRLQVGWASVLGSSGELCRPWPVTPGWTDLTAEWRSHGCRGLPASKRLTDFTHVVCNTLGSGQYGRYFADGIYNLLFWINFNRSLFLTTQLTIRIFGSVNGNWTNVDQNLQHHMAVLCHKKVHTPRSGGAGINETVHWCIIGSARLRFGVKPLPEPILTNCKLDQGKTSV